MCGVSFEWLRRNVTGDSVVEPGWDIYTGGVYRYGPSIIVEKDGSIDAWFAAPGGYHDGKNLKYDENAAVKAIELNRGTIAAQRFSETQPFYALRVVCPNNGGFLDLEFVSLGYGL